ncbi:hypothetical protein CXB51_032204 [Gossypium anomalum]|uniref:Uncharacterized protein n=1 Tax=Gossypium anomalum TaxID=47600 RepID=A0A8J6CK83_9ROSI|nr:hypothetical protein CXB51_032204 [Gossypium anomalum]
MSILIEEEIEVRKGPWTTEEDTLLTHYIGRHGVGPWNMLAKCAGTNTLINNLFTLFFMFWVDLPLTSSGLKRSGKSCRLRWLNYLNPDIKRGNLTLQEQQLILQLHSLWGNRWSKIAEHLPGRTDNEIKNYWRTRVQNKQPSSSSLKEMSSQFSVPCQLPECIVPSGSVINISEQIEFPQHETSPNAYAHTCVDNNNLVLNGSYNIGRSGQDMEAFRLASMSAVGEGCWICNEMTDSLWQCRELGEMGN